MLSSPFSRDPSFSYRLSMLSSLILFAFLVLFFFIVYLKHSILDLNLLMLSSPDHLFSILILFSLNVIFFSLNLVPFSIFALYFGDRDI